MVVAGEPSGDMHGARVIEEIKRLKPELKITAMGSDALSRVGADILVDPMGVSTIGFMEAIKNLKIHRSHIRLLKEYMRNNRPDLLFLVDYSGFNMIMARVGKKMGIPVVDYFPPTAWIWGKWRARWMARYDAVIAATLPMERDAYKKAGVEVKFVGHPLLDMVGTEKEDKEIYSKFEIDQTEKVIALMPGSRRSEIEALLPEMLTAAEKLQQKNPDYQFLLPLAPGIDKDFIAEKVGNYNLVLKIIKNVPYEVMKIADLIITASGTATLEALIMETPMIIVYKTGWTTYQLGSRLMNTDYIGMPNIIAGKKMVAEYIQDEVTAENIFFEAYHLLENDYLLQEKARGLADLKKELGSEGAVRRTAELLLKEGGLK